MNTKRPRHLRRIIVIIVAVVLAGLIAVAVIRYNRPLPALTAKITAPTVPARAVSLPWTGSGESAISTASNKVLGQGVNANKVVPIASIAKLITILTVLQKYPLAAGQTGPTITLGASDAERYAYYNALDGSTVMVTAGEQLTEYQMLQAMLLPSGDNIADSLATWAYGSLSAYRAAAQDEVNHLGMGRTLVGSDASGFLADTTSTANDLVLLGEAALKQPVITEIAAQKVATLPVAGTVYTTDLALGTSDVTGLKTGTSDEAGNCFLFTATHAFDNGQSETFVGVVLNSPTQQSRFTEAESLLNATYAGYTNVTVAKQGQSIGTITSAWGQRTTIAPASDVSEFIWSGDPTATTAKLALNTKTSLTKSQTVGTITVGSNAASVVATNAITPPSLLWRIFHS